LIVELHPDTVQLKQDVTCLGQRSFCSKVIIRTDRQTHTHNRPLYLDQKLVAMVGKTSRITCTALCAAEDLRNLIVSIYWTL